MTQKPTRKDKSSSRITFILEWFQQRSLLEACLLVIGGAFLVAGLAWWLIGFPLIGYPTWGIGIGDKLRTEAVKIVLTMVAGIGGIIALTIAYRKQRGTEEGRFMASLENAARQMGALEPTVQFAGIYALASLADESSDERKQKCVDVLCGYLRLPYTSSKEPSTLREVVEKHTYFDAHGGVEETRTHLLRPAEKEVRLTIIREITERLRPDAVSSWSKLDLDFSGVVFDGGDFSGAHFNDGRVSFEGAHFDGEYVSFFGAHFNGGVVTFRGAQFNWGNVDFTTARFDGGLVDFFGAHFNGSIVDFSRISLNSSNVYFVAAEFREGIVNFYHAQIKGGTLHFDNAAFSGGQVNLSEAIFSGGRAQFISPVSWERPPKVPWDIGKTPKGIVPSMWPPNGTQNI